MRDPDCQFRDNDADLEPTRVRALIAGRMTERSWAALSRRVGVPQLAVKLDAANTAQRLPPFGLLAKIMENVDVTLGELVSAAAHDAGYPDLTPPVSREDALMVRRLLTASPAVRRMIGAWLDWMAELDGIVGR